MDTEDTAWKERCERYFSSITESDDNVKRKVKNKEKEKEWKEISDLQRPEETSKITYAKKWLQAVDMHGWTLAGTTSNHIETVISILISLLMSGALGFLIFLNVKAFMQQSSNFVMTSHKSRINESLTYTICNNNLLRKSAVSAVSSRYKDLASLDSISLSSSKFTNSDVSSHDLVQISPLWSLLKTKLPHQDILKHLSELDEEFVPYSFMSTANDFSSLYESSVKYGDVVFRYAVRPTKAELKDYGHRLDKMLVHCWNGNRKCSNTFFSEIQDPHLGNCVKFSPEGIKTDPVILILNAEPEDIIHEITPSPGFIFVVSGAEKGGSQHHLSPGHSHHLNIRTKTTLKRTTDCDADESYEEKNCLYDCLDAQISKYCQCRYSYDVSSSSRCKINVKYEYICVRAIEILYSLEKLGCRCQPKCRSTNVNVEFSTTPWPSDGHTKYLQHFLKENGINATLATIRGSLCKVEVNVRNMLDEIVEESVDMSFIELLSRVGGSSALLVGVSLLTIIELFWLLVRTCIYCCHKLSNRSSQQEIIRRLSESEITSVTWQAYKRRRREETELPIKNGFIPNQPLRRNDSKHSRHSKRSTLSPIAEENRKSSKENQPKQNNFEEKLYARPWDRTGHSRSYNNIITSSKNAGTEFPIFNSLDEIPAPHVPPRCSTPDNSEHGNSRLLQLNGGNAHMYPYKGRIVTPADAITNVWKISFKILLQ